MRSDNQLFAWGKNSPYYLSIDSSADPKKPAPVMFYGSGIASVAAGGDFTCTLSTAGAHRTIHEARSGYAQYSTLPRLRQTKAG